MSKIEAGHISAVKKAIEEMKTGEGAVAQMVVPDIHNRARYLVKKGGLVEVDGLGVTLSDEIKNELLGILTASISNPVVAASI